MSDKPACTPGRGSGVFPSDRSQYQEPTGHLAAAVIGLAAMKSSRLAQAGVALVMIALAAASNSRAQTLTALHSFASSEGSPQGSLLRDSAGNLYGTTSGNGSVYELVNSSGNYSPKVLHNFPADPADGTGPAPGLVMDASGNIFGTTSFGGASNLGTVFELVNSSGKYTERVLYSFSGSDGDGASPASGLTIDALGNLYGTTGAGGKAGSGTVFELVNSSGNYTENVLYSFGPASPFGGDGFSPEATLLIDSAGNLYGTTSEGGSFGYGTVFELHNSSGNYTESVLHSFLGGSDGANPEAALVIDAAGNLYGTTLAGGSSDDGTVFQLTNFSGNYAAGKVLYEFRGSSGDGASPHAGVIVDAAGNLYGTTYAGGSSSAINCVPGGCGTLFELARSSGTYQENVLHSFGTLPDDGQYPTGNLAIDANGNLYGTTMLGGGGGLGIAFEFSPNLVAPGAWLSPSSLNFGDLGVGMSLMSEDLNVTNTGNAELIFGTAALTVSGPNASDFTLSRDYCSGTSVAPNSSCFGSITYTPSLVGSEAAQLNFSDNARGSPQAIALAGTGIGNTAATLSTTSLAFGNQLITTQSATQPVTLTNTGSNPLSFLASTSSNFGYTSNCGLTLAVGAGCTMNVYFLPSQAGSVSGTLTITDNAPGSPNAVALTGIGIGAGDFSLAPSGLTNPSVKAGNSAIYTVDVVPLSGFSRAVSLSCTGAPPLGTCSILPTSVTPNGINSAGVNITVTTTAATGVPQRPGAPPFPRYLPASLLLDLLAILLMSALYKTHRPAWSTKPMYLALSATALFLLVALTSSCGGSQNSGPPPIVPGTPSGTYTLTVTGASGNLTHFVNLTLNVIQ
jgi:uncharacterized repeat protein (TIGR03803 family)